MVDRVDSVLCIRLRNEEMDILCRLCHCFECIIDVAVDTSLISRHLRLHMNLFIYCFCGMLMDMVDLLVHNSKPYSGNFWWL